MELEASDLEGPCRVVVDLREHQREEDRLEEEDHHGEEDLGVAIPMEEAFRRKAEEANQVFEVEVGIALEEA